MKNEKNDEGCQLFFARCSIDWYWCPQTLNVCDLCLLLTGIDVHKHWMSVIYILRSKRIKGSTERYLLGQKHNLQFCPNKIAFSGSCLRTLDGIHVSDFYILRAIGNENAAQSARFYVIFHDVIFTWRNLWGKTKTKLGLEPILA